MAPAFQYRGSSAFIRFAPGAIEQTGEVMKQIGCGRALILSTPGQSKSAERLASQLVDMAAGVFARAAMHTPIEITDLAIEAMRESGADCTIALGGGSTIGLGKAIAYRLDTSQIVIPTTYSGSEATPILGETRDGRKTTLRDDAVLPEAVIYDPELTLGIPYEITVSSGLNAIAHATEALYAKDRNPISSLMAVEGIRAMARALPVLRETPSDLEARSDALYGAWLCGTVLGSVAMGLHHKLCHVLGGSFNLPHAQTHAVILPHAVAYNEVVAAEALSPIAGIFNAPSAAMGLHAFAAKLGAPMALEQFGLAKSDLDLAADIVLENSYGNPREITRDGILALLEAAWRGAVPFAF